MHEPLKNCPFCGSKATASVNKGESLWSHDVVDWTRVHCTNDDCNAQTEATCEGYEPSAIEVWNRRTPPAVVGEPVARVNDDGFIVEIGDLLLSPGQNLYLAAHIRKEDNWQPNQ